MKRKLLFLILCLGFCNQVIALTGIEELMCCLGCVSVPSVIFTWYIQLEQIKDLDAIRELLASRLPQAEQTGESDVGVAASSAPPASAKAPQPIVVANRATRDVLEGAASQEDSSRRWFCLPWRSSRRVAADSS